MNTYSMKAFHHKFDIFEFHEEPIFDDWFEKHIKRNTINEEEQDFKLSPEHLLLLSNNVTIFNRFKFNHNLHLPSPFCKWKIKFGNNDHNKSTTNDNEQYGI